MRALALIVCAACHHASAVGPSFGEANADITLYRDLAVIRQKVTVRLPATPTAIPVKLAAGAGRVDVLERDGVTVRATHQSGAPASPPPPARERPACEDAGECDPPEELDLVPEPEPLPSTIPGELVLDVQAPHAGTFTLVIVYTTDRLKWDADYTMTTTPARETAVLHGAVAVRNTAGIAFDRALVRVIDSPIHVWQARLAENTAKDYTGGARSTSPMAIPREIGVATLVAGETRVEIGDLAKPHAMRSVLVFDPIGTKLDSQTAVPVLDDKLGAVTKATGVVESFEVERDDHALGLPAGQVRLLERRTDGGLGVLGESRLFDAATRVATHDTIAVGAAENVTGHRKRRELTVDRTQNRAVEDFEITIDNAREHAVDVILREHLYRGQGWVLAYKSVDQADKDGAQGFSMRTRVPAKAQQKVLYSVVYTWAP